MCTRSAEELSRREQEQIKIGVLGFVLGSLKCMNDIVILN